MIDKAITILRLNEDDEPNDNSYVARMAWILILGVGLLAFWSPFAIFGETASSATVGLQNSLRIVFGSLAVAVFAASLRWPSRKIEGWLDENYPEHQSDTDYGDYSIRSDLFASLCIGGLWNIRIGIAYAVSSVILAMTEYVSVMDESGYSVAGETVARLTVVNTFAIGTLTALLAGVGLWWLLESKVKDSVDRLNTPERSTFGSPNKPTHTAATDGGATDGS
ncbi:MAG: hypothetical protein ACOCUO_01025 [archaeon]